MIISTLTHKKQPIVASFCLTLRRQKASPMDNPNIGNSATVRTKMKFVRSATTGFTVGFVSRNPKTGVWRGVRQDSSYPKKVCVLDKKLVPFTLLNKLYDVTMIPMRSGDGYVVVEAVPVVFKVKVIVTHVPRLIYRVEAKFGDKTIIFDPMEGQRTSVRNIWGAVEALSKRTDVKDLPMAVEEFTKASQEILTQYEAEMPGHKIK